MNNNTEIRECKVFARFFVIVKIWYKSLKILSPASFLTRLFIFFNKKPPASGRFCLLFFDFAVTSF